MGCFGLWTSRLTSSRKNQPMDMSEKKLSNTGIPCAYHEHAQDSASDWRMDDDAPPQYASLAAEKPEVLQTIEDEIARLNDELRALSLKIHHHPELGFEEKYAHDHLTAFMRAHGFAVEEHAYGLDTAWRASFSHRTGGRVLGVNSEMDALPGVGHACGHNLIAINGVGIALALKAALVTHDVAGTVVLLGTPAEEGGGGKIIMINRGAYKDMAACLMAHPGPGPKKSAGTGSSLAIKSLDVEFFGHTAHAGAQPWEGQNALDAAVLAYTSVGVLRQQVKPTHRIHGIVQGRDWAPNIIPDYAKMKWIVRAPTVAEVEVLYARVVNCFKAAALATSCKLEIHDNEALNDLVQNDALASEFAAVAKAHYGIETFADVAGAIGGSTDFGNVTYELPALHPSYAIPTEPNGGNHTPAFTASARTKEAHAATLAVLKSLAMVGWRVLTDDAYFQEVQDAYKRQVPPRIRAAEEARRTVAAQAQA
ncbi:amidohydrolase [Auricularia subglabra TFB-10046 SS5]|nr:amidohydrolase [Auricularia subglabra TFB-10046 SS5]